MKSLFTTILVGSLIAMSGVAYGDDKDDKLKFEANLSGAQEVVIVNGDFVPGGVDTNATGTISAKFDKGLTEVTVDLRAEDSAGVFNRAHFHCGRAGQNGLIAFGLVDPGLLEFEDDGERVTGTLTNTDFTGADCIPNIGRPVNNIAALAFAMRDGLIYANVHSTTAFPAGEIRGQMRRQMIEDD